MIKTFKTRIFPSLQQREYIELSFGVRRWAWNWAVAKYEEARKIGLYLSKNELQKCLNNNEAEDPAYSWLNDVNTMVRGEAIKDFSLAMQAYCDKQKAAKKKGEQISPDKFKPRFKKKGRCTDSFRVFRKNATAMLYEKPHELSIVGVGHQRLFIKTKESIAFLENAQLKTCTISREAGRYYAAITYEKTNLRPRSGGTGKIGLDLGIKHLAVAYDGTTPYVFDLPKNVFDAENAIARCNRRLAKTTKGSNRHEKAKLQLQRAYLHQANVRKDYREKLTTWLTATYGEVVYDDFRFEGAKGLHNLCRSLYRIGVYEFKLRFSEKGTERNVSVRIVPTGTPTTRTCSCCGEQQKMTLSQRTYECPVCGIVLDRDENSARNVYKI